MGFLFGKTKDDYMGEYNKAIKDTKQAQADAVYQQRYNQALYDANKDTFEKAGISNPGASYFKDGRMTNALQDTVKTYDDYLKDLNTEKEQVARRNKYNIYGDGLIGGLLNPFHQVGTGVQDLATSGISKWQSGERDLLSDLGAAGEVALQVVPVAGALAKGGKAAATVANSLGKSMLKGAAYGSGYGALGSLKDMGAQDFDAGELTLRTLLGGAIGGGMAGVGYGLGKVWNKYSQPAPSNSTDIVKYQGPTANGGGSGEYQNYLKTLTDNGVDTSSVDNFRKTFRSAIIKNHPDKGGSEEVAKALNEAYAAFGQGKDTKMFQDALSKATAPVGNGLPVSSVLPQQNFRQRLQNFRANIPTMGKDIANSKAGNMVSRLLKTKTGKVGLGLGSGLLLSKLMNGGSGNTNPEQMTEEELYNYIVNGGQ